MRIHFFLRLLQSQLDAFRRNIRPFAPLSVYVVVVSRLLDYGLSTHRSWYMRVNE